MGKVDNIRSYLGANQDWLTVDRDSGIGPGVIDVTAVTYFGRDPRVALIPVVSDGATKIVRCIQKGSDRLSVLPNNLRFPHEGGSRELIVYMNAASLNANLISTEDAIRSVIESIEIDGNVIYIQDTVLEAGIPMDPGARNVFEVGLVITMPKNPDHEQKLEKLVINEKVTVNIIQEPSTDAYIRVNPDNITVGNGNGSGVIDIESNTDYDIEIVECYNPCAEFGVDPLSLGLDKIGNERVIRVTAKDGLSWRVD